LKSPKIALLENRGAKLRDGSKETVLAAGRTIQVLKRGDEKLPKKQLRGLLVAASNMSGYSLKSLAIFHGASIVAFGSTFVNKPAPQMAQASA